MWTPVSRKQKRGSDLFLFLCRAFKINELKTEVTNRLAMLEKRVECKCTLAFTLFLSGRLVPVGLFCRSLVPLDLGEIRLASPVTQLVTDHILPQLIMPSGLCNAGPQLTII